MPAEQILSNARLVLADQVIHGSLLIRDGLIADISEGASSLPQAQDLGGDLLLPGLVELHTDNLEKHMSPRPGVDWPSASAVLTHDAQIVAAGITTVFDALSIGDITGWLAVLLFCFTSCWRGTSPTPASPVVILTVETRSE